MEKTAQAADEDNFVAARNAFAEELEKAAAEIDDKESVKGKSLVGRVRYTILERRHKALRDGRPSRKEQLEQRIRWLYENQAWLLFVLFLLRAAISIVAIFFASAIKTLFNVFLVSTSMRACALCLPSHTLTNLANLTLANLTVCANRAVEPPGAIKDRLHHVIKSLELAWERRDSFEFRNSRQTLSLTRSPSTQDGLAQCMVTVTAGILERVYSSAGARCQHPQPDEVPPRDGRLVHRGKRSGDHARQRSHRVRPHRGLRLRDE